MADPHSVIDGVRLFVDQEIRPRAAEFDRNEAIPRDLIRSMAERGYLAAPFPPEFGGMGLDPIAYGRTTAEVGRGCSSVRTLLTVHTSLVGETLLRWGTPQQKARFLPAMASGDLAAMRSAICSAARSRLLASGSTALTRPTANARSAPRRSPV